MNIIIVDQYVHKWLAWVQEHYNNDTRLLIKRLKQNIDTFFDEQVQGLTPQEELQLLIEIESYLLTPRILMDALYLEAMKRPKEQSGCRIPPKKKPIV